MDAIRTPPRPRKRGGSPERKARGPSLQRAARAGAQRLSAKRTGGGGLDVMKGASRGPE
jgi:hypothetical protein